LAYRLNEAGQYIPIQWDVQGRLWLETVGLALGYDDGEVAWFDADGRVLHSYNGVVQAYEAAEQRAEEERQRAEEERQRAEESAERIRQLEAELQRLRGESG
jgi:hypothetical protein